PEGGAGLDPRGVRPGAVRGPGGGGGRVGAQAGEGGAGYEGHQGSERGAARGRLGGRDAQPAGGARPSQAQGRRGARRRGLRRGRLDPPPARDQLAAAFAAAFRRCLYARTAASERPSPWAAAESCPPFAPTGPPAPRQPLGRTPYCLPSRARKIWALSAPNPGSSRSRASSSAPVLAPAHTPAGSPPYRSTITWHSCCTRPAIARG